VEDDFGVGSAHWRFVSCQLVAAMLAAGQAQAGLAAGLQRVPLLQGQVGGLEVMPV
jgi:hypothetical protein